MLYADLVLCLFQGPTRAAVIQASDRLGIPCERLMEPEWLPQTSPSPKPAKHPQNHTDTRQRT